MTSRNQKKVNEQKDDGYKAALLKAQTVDTFVTKICESWSRIRDEQEEPPPQGTLFDRLKQDNTFINLTNFPETKIVEISRLCDPIWLQQRGRGPKPKVSLIDSVIIALIYYKTGQEVSSLGPLLEIKENTFREVLKRIRPVLLKALTTKWWENRIRPHPLADTNFPFVGLLVDVNLQEPFRPKTRFEEAKIYWDDHNKAYGVKKTVAILANDPYYAMFSLPGEVGSYHDYEIFKQQYQQLVPYLQKQEQEKQLIATDRNELWAVLGDSGYSGPDSDTTGLRRIFIKRPEVVEEDRVSNHEKAKIRVKIEQFFGRQEKLWTLTAKTYRNSHKTLDADFDISILLTNEHIAVNEEANKLVDADRDFHLALSESRLRRFSSDERKRKAQQQKYTAKRRRLNGY